MRNKTSLFKRSLAGLLTLVLVLGMIPILGGGNIALEAEAAPVDEGGNTPDYITMPITIRDFAADGMLFEYNETGDSGIAYKGTSSGTIPVYRSKYISETGYSLAYAYVMEYNQQGSSGYFDEVDPEANQYWHVIFVNSDGSINRVYPKETPTADPAIPEGGMVIFAFEGCNNYTFFSGITDSTKANYSFGSVTSDSSTAGAYVSYTKHEAVYHQKDTKGFGMLYTDTMDIEANLENNIYLWETTGAIGASLVAWNDPTIAVNNGTQQADGSYIYDYYKTVGETTYGPFTHYSTYAPYGLWDYNVSSDGYANQMLYGGTIRTNLMQRNLVDGKPIYTENAVKYIAEYMKLALSAEWQNADGSYNTFYVTGDEVADGETLAERIRQQVNDDPTTTADDEAKMGSYEASYNKFFDANNKFSGNLDHYSEIETWYDAAFYLMHSTWRDSEQDAEDAGSDGYGKLAPEYHSLHLVAKEVDGKSTYVFNSMYKYSVYNPTTGEIYNTQTTEVEQAYTTAGTAATADGNIQPVDRFDPLGVRGTGSYRGYGIPSPDTYGDMITDSDANWADYYDDTNYHLSLEGHAQFVYHEDADQYFTFTGDDDVYLYINNVRVLDIGGGHSIAKVSININDFAEVCGLVDGETYPFDFFYMERHGTAANFGIETNIQIVDPAMTTTKNGYQNGVNTGYNGYVAPNEPVVYEFGIENKSNAKISELTFNDDRIGVSLTKDAIALNNYTTISDLSVTIYNKPGSDGTATVKNTYAAGTLDEGTLKGILATGLEAGEKIIIHGFEYTIPANIWENRDGSNDYFYNIVNTTAKRGDSVLTGTANWVVQKRLYDYQDFHVYEWKGKGVTLTKDELLKPLVDVGVTITNDVTIFVSSASGATTGTNVNNKAQLNTADDSITYTGTEVGADTFYYTVISGSLKAVIGVAVYSYDVADNVYVLDYGLKVELNCDKYGFRANDHLEVPQNIHAPTTSIFIRPLEVNYGDFEFIHKQDKDENGAVVKDYGLDPISASVQYVPDEFMSGDDSFKAEIVICEPGKEFSKFTGVTMEEYVTTAPANVVYYEENFPGITYVEKDENDWIHYETVDSNNQSTAGSNQSPDQDSNYGSDPNYAEDKVGTLVEQGSVGTVKNTFTLNLDIDDLDDLQAAGIEALNAYLGLGGSDSNGSVNKLEIKETYEDVMYFEFVGTGFEIIGRTTDNEYAIINVQVEKKNADGTYTIVRMLPVITESKGGTLYQVPVISVTGMERATYRVVLKSGTTGNQERVMYIDGVRIYGPLDDDKALEYYNPEEYKAEFYEIKQLIQSGHMIYADYSAYAWEDGISAYPNLDPMLVTGTTMVEDISGEGSVLTTLGDEGGESVDDYLQIGPNNELYLDGNNTNGLIAFFLTPVADYPDAERTLEIGAHRKANSVTESAGYVTMGYGSVADDVINNTNFYEIKSATEMYYTIDVEKLTPSADGKYLVMIGASGSEEFDTWLALTSIKVAGYEISFAQTDIMDAANNDTLDELSIVEEPFKVLKARREAMKQEPEVEQVRVNENLTINSVKLTAVKVVSGKTATLTVKASADAEVIVITDADGNEVEMTKCTRKVSGGVVTFTCIWKVVGSRGQELNYTVRVYDAKDLASVNAETVTVTIK